jgi:hypothetical protein
MLAALLFLAVVLLGAIFVISPMKAAVSEQPSCPPDELLVKFQPDADAVTLSAKHGATIVSMIPGIDVYLLAVPAGTAEAKIAEFQSDPGVVFAEQNGLMSVPEQPPPAPSPCGVQVMPE